jgi:hypothetical protein
MLSNLGSIVIQHNVDSDDAARTNAINGISSPLPPSAFLSPSFPSFSFRLDTPYFIIIGLGALKLFTPNTMVTRGSLEARPRRGIIPHVGLHRARVCRRRGASEDRSRSALANKAVAEFTARAAMSAFTA